MLLEVLDMVFKMDHAASKRDLMLQKGEIMAKLENVERMLAMLLEAQGMTANTCTPTKA